MSELVIGIDLGTTNSCAAIYRNGQIDVIPTKSGAKTTPSIVCFPDRKSRLVGEEAKSSQYVSTKHFENTVYGTKRLIGRSPNDPTIEADRKAWPFEVKLESGRPMIKIANRSKPMLVEEVSAAVLSSIKQDAETFLGEPVNKCVITVPAYFTNVQRQATIQAGQIAGFQVQRIVNEPTAAAYSFGLLKTLRNASAQNVFIFDLGGGTFDISILRVEKGQFTVLATKGDSHLGGEDIDNRLLSFFLQELNKQHGIRFEVGSEELAPVKRKLKKHVESFKHAFASQSKVEAVIDCVAPDAHGDLVDLKLEMTRAKFDSAICGAFTEKAIAPIQEVLDMAGLTKEQIDTVLLVGGSTRLPKVREELGRFFPPEKISKEVNPDEAVAQGAAILGGIVSKVPLQKPEGIHVSDATSFPIGVAVANDGFSVLIEKNVQTPCTFTKNYSTHRDNQPRLRFVIYEGENRQSASANQHLAELIIPLPAESKAGEVTVSVTFTINDNGILEITALNQATNEVQQLEITYQAQIDPNELAECIKEEQVLASLPAKEKARGRLETAMNTVLEPTKGDVNYQLDGVAPEVVSAIVSTALEAKAWLTGINFYDLGVTDKMFAEWANKIKKAGPDAFAALEEEFFAPE